MPSRGKRTFRDRKVDEKPQIPRILIVCEGERTEPNYFRAFKVTNAIKDIRGEAMNTVSLVRRAVEIRDAEGSFDQVWCVFDLDDFPKQHFNEAIRLAKKEKVKVAYSNEAFELWYVLHFDYLQTEVNRERYKTILTERLGKKYSKLDADIYGDLLSQQSTAIANAQRLLHDVHLQHLNASEKKPSTTVHELVIELNKHMRQR